MSIVRRAVQKALSTTGYKIVHRASSPVVAFSTFANLSQAYELVFNQLHTEHAIPANETRPKLLARLMGTPPSEAFAIIHALAKTRLIDGDVCEFGVAQGETSALIANEIGDTNKQLHLFDSFQGLPKPTEQDQLKDDIFSLGSMDAYEGTMSCPEDMVITRLKAIAFPSSRYVIHPGFIEDILRSDQKLPTHVSFAYVDFDFYQPIKATLEFLDRTTGAGSMIIVDDYNWFSTGAKTATDEFISEKNAAATRYDIVVPDTRLGYFAVLTKQS